MGEVYVAHDERLGREVALKRMHPGLGVSIERVKRFEQEARAASAINHPNILAVFDIGEADGAPYIVTELLDGDTLRELLTGPLGVRKSLDLGRQIALGLAAAHERGIIHRDIKPENLFVTRDGHLKILDFGVAKLTGTESDVTDERPTTPALTTPDAVLGTPGYMAPEQVRGDPVDQRADLFALGAVLYEMITGKRAFGGGAAHAVMYQVLHGEPPPIPESVGGSPVIDAVVRRCLEKRRDERFASARDLAFQLEALSTAAPSGTGTGAGTGSVPPIPAAPSTTHGRRPRSRQPLVIGLIAAVAIVAVAASWLREPRTTRAPTPPASTPAAPTKGAALPDLVPNLTPLTFRSGRITSARLSRDGRTLYVGAAWGPEPQGVYAVVMGHAETTALGVEGDVVGTTVDGEVAVLLGAWTGMETPRTLALMSPSGRSRREIAEQVEYADVGLDDRVAVVRRVGARCRLEYPIGTTIDETDGWFSHPRISPDGRRLAYLVHPMRDDDRGWPAIAEADGTHAALTAEWLGVQGVAWRPDGDGIYFSAAPATSMRSILFACAGEPVRRVTQVPANLDVQEAMPDGSLIGFVFEWTVQARLHDPDGSERDISWYDTTNPADLASDGRLLFFEGGLATSTSGYVGYLRRLDGTVVELGAGLPLELSPDGKHVLTMEPATLGLSVRPVGAGTARTIATGNVEAQGAWWFPDGARLLLDGAAPGEGERLWVVSSEGGTPTPLTAPGQIAMRQERPLSPDGTQVSFLDHTGARGTILVASGEVVPSPALEPGERFLRWSGDGAAWVIGRTLADHSIVLTRAPVTGRRTELATIRTPECTIAEAYLQVRPDGRGWAYACYTISSRVYQITLVPSTVGAPQ